MLSVLEPERAAFNRKLTVVGGAVVHSGAIEYWA
jgi:hypothetical protein